MKFYYSHNLPQRYIDTRPLLQYIDYLKTRIYKAFCQKSRLQAYHLQFLCANSPLVILAGVQTSIEDAGHQFDLFELGYLAFSLSANLCLDTSFYIYYRENTFLDTIHLFSSLIDRIKYTTAIFCIEPCQIYLFSKANLPFGQFEHIEALNNFLFGKIDIFKQGMSLNLESCFDYCHMYALIKRLPMHSEIKLHLLKCLSRIEFNNMVSCFCFLSDQTVFVKNGRQLFAKLLDTLIYFTCSEIYAALDVIGQYINRVLFINCNSSLFILSEDYLVLNLLNQELGSFLHFNGVRLTHAVYLCKASLFNLTDCKLLFIIMRNADYPFNFVIRPSLLSQFNLMRRISFVISYSVSQPLFLLTIRLNKLLLLWTNMCICCGTGKILYLMDYLVYLKLRLFAKRHFCFPHSLSFLILFRLNDENSCINLNMPSNLIATSVFTDYLYSYYIAVKMFWIYTLKCLSG